MILRRAFAASLVLLSARCTAPNPIVKTDRGHPASADAPASPAPHWSKTLAIAEPVNPSATQKLEPHGAMQDTPHGSTAASAQSGNTPADQHATQLYTCPMHPEIVTEEPGRCPKCGMKLVPMKGGG